MAEKSVSLGQLLLSRVRSIDGLSPYELHTYDCILIQCLRSDGATRVAHRCVLEIASDFFAQEIARCRPSSVDGQYDATNIMQLDVSSEVLDIILEFLYTREPVQVVSRLAIQTYSAVKRFCLPELAVQLVEYFRANLESCLEDDKFLDTSKSIADVDSLVDAFEDLQPPDTVKLRLMQQIRNWSADAPNTEKSRIAWSACDKLLSLSLRPPPTSTIQAPSTTSNTHMALMGFTNVKTGEFACVSLNSMSVLFSGRQSDASSSPNLNSFVYNGYHYVPWLGKVFIRSPLTNELCRELTTFNNNVIKGVQVFRDELFFYTSEDVYVLDQGGVSVTQLAHVNFGSVNSFKSLHRLIILRRDATELTIAVPIAEEQEVRAVTFSRDASMIARSCRLQTLPHDMLPIGYHDEMLYFRTAKLATFYYAAFRGDTEVKRTPVDDCLKVSQCSICNGRLYLLYHGEGDRRALRVRGIDLSTDSTVFLRSCDEWSLQGVAYMVPAVGPPPEPGKSPRPLPSVILSRVPSARQSKLAGRRSVLKSAGSQT